MGNAQQLLDALHRGGQAAYAWQLGERRATWWHVGGTLPIIADSAYFGVHPTTSKRGPNQRARVNDIAAINTVYADIDSDPSGGKEAALQHVRGLSTCPSVVVDSGGGYHCYWLLARTFAIASDAERERAKRLQRAWAVCVGGDPAASDLARVLRLPGTLNHKYDPARPVRILTADFGLTYEMASLEREAHGPTSGGDNLAPAGSVRYADAALRDEVAAVRGAAKGTRNCVLNRAAFSLGTLVGAGALGRGDVERELLTAASMCGLQSAEAIATMKSGLDAGEGSPRALPSAGPPSIAAAPSADAPPRKEPKQADRLIEIAEAVTLFHDQHDTAYARFAVGDHSETWPVRSSTFRSWLARAYHMSEGSAPNSDALVASRHVIEGRARFGAERHGLHTRVARSEGAIWIDLADERWRAIRVGDGEWDIADEPPLVFRRFAHQQAQVDPSRDGDLGLLAKYLPVEDADDMLLLLVYVVAALIPDTPRPALILHGTQGSGKSTAFRVLKCLLDPSAIEMCTLPRAERELVQLLSHHYFVAFDNLGMIPDWASDALCRAVTGGGFSKRALFTDDDDVIYSFRRAVGLNGVSVAATRPDLLDRAILIGLERIAPGERRPEAELWPEFARDRPRILGGILDTLARAFELYPAVETDRLPRMADFARWGIAITRAMGASDGDFLTAFSGNVGRINDEVLQGHPVAAAVVDMMAEREEWVGTPTELFGELTTVAARLKIEHAEGFPKTAHWVTRRMAEVAPYLADAGITFRRAHGTVNTITLSSIADDARGDGGDAAAVSSGSGSSCGG
ncbi:hypothetical protein HOI71_11815, partial [Candidatus Poribacteria bacterium]|nr:hypothetical protein [Candidatus Poribacteria bacterium]